MYQLFYDGEAEPEKIKGLNLGGGSIPPVSSVRSKASVGSLRS